MFYIPHIDDSYMQTISPYCNIYKLPKRKEEDTTLGALILCICNQLDIKKENDMTTNNHQQHHSTFPMLLESTTRILALHMIWQQTISHINLYLKGHVQDTNKPTRHVTISVTISYHHLIEVNKIQDYPIYKVTYVKFHKQKMTTWREATSEFTRQSAL